MTDPLLVWLAAVGAMALLVAFFVAWVSDRDARRTAANVDRMRASLRQQLETEGLGEDRMGGRDGAPVHARTPDAAGTR